jgi:branched-chain amino acid transport system substrate-binding protein
MRRTFQLMDRYSLQGANGMRRIFQQTHTGILRNRLGKSGRLAILAITLVMAAGTAMPAVAGAAGTSTGVTAKTVTIGVITTQTGPLAGNWASELVGFRSEIAALNATGGINGRKIKLITEDDASVDANDLAAAQSLVQGRGVFAVVDLTAGVPNTLSYLNAAEVPVVAAGSSPTQGLPTNFNIYGVRADLTHGARISTLFGKVFKSLGARKIGVLAYGSIAASIDEAESGYGSAKSAGLNGAYENLTVPIGITSWTPYVLAMKAAKVDGFFTGLDVATSLAFIQAAGQQGLTLHSFIAIGYNSSLLVQPANSIAQGITVGAEVVPTELNTPATKLRTQIYHKYGKVKGAVDAASIPGYVAGLLLREGLSVAGPQLTRTAFINNLRQVKNWTADGNQVAPVDFSISASSPKAIIAGEGAQNCLYLLKVSGTAFKPLSNKPVCGTLLPES